MAFKKELMEEVKDLKRRIEKLEASPNVIYIPYPVNVSNLPNYSQPVNPYFQPYQPTIICGNVCEITSAIQ